LEVLRKISKEQLLAYKRRQPKLSDLELISLSLTGEFIGIDARMTFLENFQKPYQKKQNIVFTTEDEEN
jgi:hypothetical protein